MHTFHLFKTEKIARHAAGFFLALVASWAHASALEQFKTFVATTHSAQGEFTQRLIKAKRTDGSKAADVVSSGTFTFDRPGKFIWIYQHPYEQWLQADGEQLFIFDKDLNQVTIRKLNNALGSSPAAILFGSNDLEKNFNLQEGGAKDGMEWLQATPKVKDTTFDQIDIGLKNGVPQAMQLRDSFGQVSVLSFQKFERHPILKPGQFKFVVPKGADVLQQ